MIILIAESKTMKGEEEGISPILYSRHIPAGEQYASEIMDILNDMSIPELIDVTKMSPAMASRLKKMAFGFHDKSLGYRAIEAFTGVVFKNLDYPSLTPEEKQDADHHVRIISSLYGWLRPDDIIKPYRLEYTSPLSPDDTPLWKFWRGKVTVELVRSLQAKGDTAILDLLPSDAAKCIDWKLVKRFAKVWKVDFLEQDGANVRSPHAGRLKALRGRLLREIITTGIDSPTLLRTFSNSDFLPVSGYKYSDRIAFMA